MLFITPEFPFFTNLTYPQAIAQTSASIQETCKHFLFNYFQTIHLVETIRFRHFRPVLTALTVGNANFWNNSNRLSFASCITRFDIKFLIYRNFQVYRTTPALTHGCEVSNQNPTILEREFQSQIFI